MIKKGKHPVTPYLVLAISILCTTLAVAFASRYTLEEFRLLLLLLGAAASCFLFSTTRATVSTRQAKQRLQEELEQHRTKLKELISQTPGVVWEIHGGTGAALRMTFISDYVETMLGFSALEWTNTPDFWRSVIHPEDRDRVAEDMAQVLKAGAGSTKFRWIAKDGKHVWVETHAAALLNQRRQVIGLRCFTMDITARHNAEETLRDRAEALRASEERYRMAARATNDAIWDWDLASGLVQWNEGIRSLFGYTPEEVGAGVAWRFNQIHPSDRDRVISGINAVIEGGGRFWSDEYQFRCANGSYAIVNDRAYIEHNESGKAVRLIAAMTDVTRLKQAEREREQLLRLEHTARKQAESANRVKDEFIATLSHELRTPLTPILGWTQLLRHRAADPASLERGLDVIEQNARSQAKLIDDLLDVSRIVTGKMRIKSQMVELWPIVQAAIDAVQPGADSKGVRIQVTPAPFPIQLAADPDRLQQVFWNLLSNAIKFTPNGGVVSVSAERAEADLRITVRDSGEGIDPEFLPHVFERFSQANSTNVRAHGGLGIGLAIVRYIVELHGGSVAVHSTGRGSGSTFTVALPLRMAESKTRGRRTKGLAKAVSSLKGLRLLVVDDEPDVRELLALVLEHEGAIVGTAASADDALRMLEVHSPDILISDIAMPEENGFVLLNKLREIERTHHRHPIPAIALTAYAREEDRRRSLNAGFEMHLSKPVSSEELVSALIAVARRHLGKAG